MSTPITPTGTPTTTQAMRNLLDHAAARLAEEDGLKHLHENAFTTSMSSGIRANYSQAVSAAAAAMAYAEAALRFASACLTEGEPSNVDTGTQRHTEPAAGRTAGGGRKATREPAS